MTRSVNPRTNSAWLLLDRPLVVEWVGALGLSDDQFTAWTWIDGGSAPALTRWPRRRPLLHGDLIDRGGCQVQGGVPCRASYWVAPPRGPSLGWVSQFSHPHGEERHMRPDARYH